MTLAEGPFNSHKFHLYTEKNVAENILEYSWEYLVILKNPDIDIMIKLVLF